MYITRSIQDRADYLSKESEQVNESLTLVSQLSNLSLQLYSWYIKNGHCRNEEESIALQDFFQADY